MSAVMMMSKMLATSFLKLSDGSEKLLSNYPQYNNKPAFVKLLLWIQLL